MNKKQRKLYKAIEALANAIMTIEEAVPVVSELSKTEIQEVVDVFSKKMTEFDINDLYRDSYNYEPTANTILSEIASKLKLDV